MPFITEAGDGEHRMLIDRDGRFEGKRVMNEDRRYRFVIDMASLKA